MHVLHHYTCPECVCVLKIDVQDNEATSFIFESDDARTADKLMVLIHGSGVVRAGQWARRYICMISSFSTTYEHHLLKG